MITLNLNGKDHALDVPQDMPLLWVIRDVAGYSGTKFGCGMGLCGACTVHVDGQATRACITPVGLAVGKKITTLEALHADPVGQALSLRHIQPDSRGHPGRRQQAAGGQGMSRSDMDDFAVANLSRRGFLKGMAASSVLVIAASWGWREAFAEERKYGADGMEHGWVDDPKVFSPSASTGW